MAGVPPIWEEGWSSPEESIDVVRLRGEVNAQYAELRGELRTSLSETNSKIDLVAERLGSMRWMFALAIPLAVAVTAVIVTVVQLLLETGP